MNTITEIIPFAKEMLNQRPCWGIVKIYTLGSTLAILGVVGGLLEMLFLPFEGQETAEETPVELIKEKKSVLMSHAAFVYVEVTDGLETEEIMTKHLVSAGRRSSVNRLHAY
ncbi:hypothetical protein JOB18_034807 [Solea senegalensis]|uniref:G0/G1 switch protein 2 n=1 Tax=Solea senegalensis TaxID=28829 RepID=A0AAV6SW56_SOLSE|nr:G0/G1 switch protein 2-like [Solea senegalensis]XP_058498183.1 G0/G1 switch protein 2-like [Solea solea]KAG7520707.1 hypothetical protein JOB18_034807 [Solea senegalensis]